MQLLATTFLLKSESSHSRSLTSCSQLCHNLCRANWVLWHNERLNFKMAASKVSEWTMGLVIQRYLCELFYLTHPCVSYPSLPGPCKCQTVLLPVLLARNVPANSRSARPLTPILCFYQYLKIAGSFLLLRYEKVLLEMFYVTINSMDF